MHNLDRQPRGTDSVGSAELEAAEAAGEFEAGEYSAGQFESGEFETGEFESAEFETGEFETGEFGGELENEGILGLLGSILGETSEHNTSVYGRALTENQETELAAELLETGSEQELEQFLGDLMRGAARAAGSFINSDTGQALGQVLKTATKQALPIVGRAVGRYFSPTRGGDIGGRIGDAVGVAFGLELEGMSGEAQEFEVARAVIRFADAAARQAARMPRGVPAPLAVQQAVLAAASTQAPGLLAGINPARAPGLTADRYGSRNRRSGRWIRRGRKLVIFDA